LHESGKPPGGGMKPDYTITHSRRRRARKILSELSSQDSDENPVYLRAKNICKSFQSNLEELFFDENGTNLYYLARKHGVF